MLNDHRVLVCIPARGGSKRLPGKNIMDLTGQPMIAYAIKAAQQATTPTVVMVSTDDEKIADVARRFGAEVPFLRPPELASDTAKAVDALEHTVRWYEQRGQQFEIIVLIQPTAPLVIADDIDQAVHQLVASGANSCVTMSPISQRPEWMYTIDQGRTKPFMTAGGKDVRSQDLPTIYHINGSVYAVRRQTLMTEHKIVDEHSLAAVIVPRQRCADIDDLTDFWLAEALLHHRSP